MTSVTMFTTPYCAYCKMAKIFFEKHNIEYSEKDVAADTVARDDMIKKSGQFGVPVFEINGKIIIGFDQSRLKESLGIS
ncbi:MAG: glutathione S-transferase N-terminal domain-containing protein [Candidatus Sungbacteria bacterium]|nr:glutathione S-transferase N-terminal domain-containing protein [Candidatus Sungbacteria bacterium]